MSRVFLQVSASASGQSRGFPGKQLVSQLVSRSKVNEVVGDTGPITRARALAAAGESTAAAAAAREAPPPAASATRSTSSAATSAASPATGASAASAAPAAATAAAASLFGKEPLHWQELVWRDVEFVPRRVARRHHALRHFNGEHTGVDRAEDLLNLTHLRFVLQENRAVEVRDLDVRELAHRLALAGVHELANLDN
eukprot:CAMPEP_0117639022 /NCGR_PEP_ID=MMETSP0802-20121206/8124_1 /TAXON_ID=38833 /ORGANISM="Micromonas sp., Strain CCMP2099" /LENGTH=197 /DNA_ID=CAMNT_0005443965 /DNA_START=62 /DNA_END=656 /DNA_ORIENTATION=+